MELHVRFLSRAVTEKDIRQIFEPFGKVSSTTLILNESTGEPIGLGIVDMPDDQEAQEAVLHLEGLNVKGERLALDEERARVGRRLGPDRRCSERRANDRRTVDRRGAVRLGVSLA